MSMKNEYYRLCHKTINHVMQYFMQKMKIAKRHKNQLSTDIIITKTSAFLKKLQHQILTTNVMTKANILITNNHISLS